MSKHILAGRHFEAHRGVGSSLEEGRLQCNLDRTMENKIGVAVKYVFHDRENKRVCGEW